MASIWMRSGMQGHYDGDRQIKSGLAEKDAREIAAELNAEFNDMGLPIVAWMED